MLGMHTIKWIQENFEWSMGCGGSRNEGQCPICHAVSPIWLLNRGGWGRKFGHRESCGLAKALKEDNIEVVMEVEM